MPAGAPITVPDPVPSFVTDSIMIVGFVKKVAVTEVAALTVTVQAPVPEQAPLQPAKEEPAAGVAVRVMGVPKGTACEQVAPQVMPPPVTVPTPAPLLVTDRVIGCSLKVAVTEVAALTVTAQAPVPEQAPLQPVKDEPAAGEAVRVMGVPEGTACEQVAPQECRHRYSADAGAALGDRQGHRLQREGRGRPRSPR